MKLWIDSPPMMIVAASRHEGMGRFAPIHFLALVKLPFKLR